MLYRRVRLPNRLLSSESGPWRRVDGVRSNRCLFRHLKNRKQLQVGGPTNTDPRTEFPTTTEKGASPGLATSVGVVDVTKTDDSRGEGRQLASCKPPPRAPGWLFVTFRSSPTVPGGPCNITLLGVLLQGRRPLTLRFTARTGFMILTLLVQAVNLWVLTR